MALWKLVLHSYNGFVGSSNETVNVFGYKSNLPVLNEATTLADEFLAQVLPAIAEVCHAAQNFTQLEIFDVEFGIEYLNRIITPVVTGVKTGDSMPNFVAWGFKYNRANINERSGSKRFGCIAEAEVADGNPTPGATTDLNDLAAALAAPITIGITQTWFPVILEREAAGVYPWGEHPIAGVTFTRVTTQNSRKR